MRLRRERPDLPVAPGERLLAWASTADGGAVGGTREALYVAGRRIPWEGVEAADWDLDSSVLTVSEVGTWGQERPTHRVTIEEPGRLLELVRERVTASIVLQRHVPIRGKRGVRVIARRAPHSRGEIAWLFSYDAGIDPEDPEIRAASERALAEAAADVDLG